jgi:hypothetical protein
MIAAGSEAQNLEGFYKGAWNVRLLLALVWAMKSTAHQHQVLAYNQSGARSIQR